MHLYGSSEKKSSFKNFEQKDKLRHYRTVPVQVADQLQFNKTLGRMRSVELQQFSFFLFTKVFSITEGVKLTRQKKKKWREKRIVRECESFSHLHQNTS